MEKNEHLWWPTPVWEIKTDFDTQFNQALLQETLSMNNKWEREETGQIDIWKNTKHLKNLNILKNEIIKNISESVSDYYPKEYQPKISLSRGWVNTHKYGEGINVHGHGKSALAVVYYIKSPPNCGNLLLISPLGHSELGWTITPKGTGFKFKEIVPEEGKLVFFPGYVLHMVENNKSYETRVSLTTNTAF